MVIELPFQMLTAALEKSEAETSKVNPSVDGAWYVNQTEWPRVWLYEPWCRWVRLPARRGTMYRMARFFTFGLTGLALANLSFAGGVPDRMARCTLPLLVLAADAHPHVCSAWRGTRCSSG